MFDIHDLPWLSRKEAESRIRALGQSQYLGDHRILGRCLGRYKMFLDGRDLGFAPHILLDGYWEYWITRFVVETIRPGMTVIDVGANFGYYSVLFADLVGADGRVLAVEPNPQVAASLRDTIAINGFHHVRVEQVALGRDGGGEVLFHIPEHEPKNARVVSSKPLEHGPGRTISVPATSIDALAADLDRLDFIKVDAEGGETDILEGMGETLKRLKPALLLEFNAARIDDPKRLLSQLEDTYGSLSYVDVNGAARRVTIDELLSRQIGEDWMLYCSHGPEQPPAYERFLLKGAAIPGGA